MSEVGLPFLRPDLPAPSSFAVAERPHRAKLDQNEAPLPPPEPLREAVLEAVRASPWNRYGQPRAYREVKERFAAAVGHAPEQVALTVGGDQALLLGYWLAGGAGRRARVFEPTYPMLAHYALVTQTALDRVVLGADFALGEAELGERVDLCALVRPNNPTGGGPSRATVEAALERHGLVLLDEAYVDYAGDSLAGLGAPNLLVARSLSKSLLAAARLGYVVGDARVVEVAERILFAPYHLSAFQLAVAAEYGRLKPLVAELAARTVAERERVAAALRARGVRVWPGGGNFLLFAPEDARGTWERLLGAGVRVRDVSGMPGLGAHLRVTIGTAAENDLFLEAV